MLHNFLKSPKQATPSLSEPQAQHYQQPRFTAWLHLGISMPSTSSSHLRLLCSSGRVPQANTLRLTSAHTTWETPEPVHLVDSLRPHPSEYHHPVLAQLILHRGWRLVVSGHSQSLQLISVGKSLPLMCQQQPALNYKRRIYSDHTKGTARVLNLGDRGGCTTGPHRMPTTLVHTTKTQSQSIPT